MTTEPDEIRQQQWALVVWRSFGISDAMTHEEARKALVASIEEQLRENGWTSAPRAVADPMAAALLTFGARSEFDSRELSTEVSVDEANRLVDHGLMVIDPEQLAYDVRGEHPAEVVTVAQAALARVIEYAGQQN